MSERRNPPRKLLVWTGPAGWSEWTPSYAEWANGGKGGYVCTRAITWAYESTDTGPGHATAFCVQASAFEYFNFLGGWHLPVTTPIYNSSACTTNSGTSRHDVVYTPDGEEKAKALCTEAFGGYPNLITYPPFPVWGCKEYV